MPYTLVTKAININIRKQVLENFSYFSLYRNVLLAARVNLK